MTTTEQPPTPPMTPEAPGPDDPRYAFAHVADAIGKLIESTGSDMLSNKTPCPEFAVKDLLDHIVEVMRRVAAIGRGEHWSTVQAVPVEQGWADDYRSATHEVMLAWSDPATLDQVLEVPWGEFPGALLLHTFAAELAVHAWDVAHATGQPFSIDDDLLRGALVAAKFIPAEGRDTPEMPFSAVVDPGPDAPVLDQISGWMGRNVLG